MFKNKAGNNFIAIIKISKKFYLCIEFNVYNINYVPRKNEEGDTKQQAKLL